MPLNKNIKIELLASVWIMLPYIVVLNALIFGYCIFNSFPLYGASYSSEDVYLVVENNLSKKKNIDSTGIGLATIREKYKLLQREDVSIEEKKDDRFIVNLPLIKPVS